MCKSLLEEYKGKVIGIYGFDFDEMKNAGVNLKLLDCDTTILKLQKINGNIMLKPISSIIEINPPDDEETKKFYEYVKKFKNDPDFEGDVPDKGYKLIKRKKRVRDV